MRCRVAGIVRHSLVNGPGIRLVVFLQGCTHRCTGCQNPDTWETAGGEETDTAGIEEIIGKTKLLDGITLSGGDPLLQAEAASDIASFAKSLGLSVWCYTGWTFEAVLHGKVKGAMELLKHVDVLVDGPFVESLKSDKCLYRGSTNQRLVDVEKSLAAGRAVEWTDNKGNRI